MKTHQYTYASHICTCQNQYLLPTGTVCEVCMGTVAQSASQDPTKQGGKDEVFDEAYFEALESFYEDITFAA